MGLPHSRVGGVLAYEVARVAQAATQALSKMHVGRRDLRDSPLLPEVPAPSLSKPTLLRSWTECTRSFVGWDLGACGVGSPVIHGAGAGHPGRWRAAGAMRQAGRSAGTEDTRRRESAHSVALG